MNPLESPQHVSPYLTGYLSVTLTDVLLAFFLIASVTILLFVVCGKLKFLNCHPN